jgi:hypothetical protein
MKRLTIITLDWMIDQVGANFIKKAANNLGVELRFIASDKFSMSELKDIEFYTGEGLYREATDSKSKKIEERLIARNDHLKTIYKGATTRRLTGWSQMLRLQSKGISVIPTVIVDEINNQEEQLQAAVESLGGYPVVLKQVGLSHGAGVELIDSQRSLVEKISKIDPQTADKYAIRKFIADYRHARLIVLDGRVIDSIEYIKPESDFRTNASAADIRVIEQDFGPEIESLGVSAVKEGSTTFAGVDILIDKGGIGYLAEVNSPCFFARAQSCTGKDTAQRLVEYLVGGVRA